MATPECASPPAGLEMCLMFPHLYWAETSQEVNPIY